MRMRLRCLQLLFFSPSPLEVRKLLLGVLSRICVTLQPREPAVARGGQSRVRVHRGPGVHVCAAAFGAGQSILSIVPLQLGCALLLLLWRACVPELLEHLRHELVQLALQLLEVQTLQTGLHARGRLRR